MISSLSEKEERSIMGKSGGEEKVQGDLDSVREEGGGKTKWIKRWTMEKWRDTKDKSCFLPIWPWARLNACYSGDGLQNCSWIVEKMKRGRDERKRKGVWEVENEMECLELFIMAEIRQKQIILQEIKPSTSSILNQWPKNNLKAGKLEFKTEKTPHSFI